MRAFAILGAFATACGSAPAGGSPDGPAPARCSAPLPAYASGADGALVARCGDLEVRVRPRAGGVVQLRYGKAGAVPRRSLAVIDEARPEPAAQLGGEADQAAACTPEFIVRIDATCRVHAERRDGTAVLEDLAPFEITGGTGQLVRQARTDRVYGLGERTGGLDKRGRAWTFWNTDAYDPAHGGWAPGQDPLYQSIPLEVRLDGAGAIGQLTDEPRRMTVDLGAADPTRDAISVALGADPPVVEQYLIAGPSMADVLDRYTQLTGRPALPPRWALGFHQSRWGYTSGSELEAIAARFRAEGIPADALWLDIQHLRGFRTFTFDEPAFSTAMIGRLAAQGFRTIAIADPGIKVDPGWDVYDGGLAGDHFLHTAAGPVFEGTAWPGSSAFPDFSRPQTRAWWGEHVRTLAARGVAGVWLDVNEPTTFPEGGGGNSVPGDVPVAGDGAPSTMATLHNAYALLEARATFDALATGGTRPFVLSRAGYAGIGRYAAVWTGDTPSTWDGLAQTLPMMLGLGVSGVPIVGSDIGGYSGHASPELYARWLALGSISPFARAHVTSGVPGQEPWMFGAEVTDVARARLADRYRLMPYLYSLADLAARTGAPILRPLVWEFPDDPAVATLDDQAMLGPFVLAAPILTAGATSRDVHLPAGRWTELHSGAIYDGPTTVHVAAPLAALPLYVRAGAILPTWPDGPDGPLQLELYPGAPSSFVLYEDDGTTGPARRTTLELAAEPDGARLTITGPAATSVHPLVLRVHGVDGAVQGVDGADAFHADAGARVVIATVTPGATTVRLRFDPALTDPRPPVPVTFEVHVPAATPMTTQIHVATSSNAWTHVALPWVAPGVARGTLLVPRGDWFDYKFTRGGWDTVEKLAGCAEAPNRYRFGEPTTQVDSVATWRDLCP